MIYEDLTLQMRLADFNPKNLKWFYPSLLLPLILLPYNLLLGLIFLLATLRLPHFILWLKFKSRKRTIQEELPLFLYAFSWVASNYPVPEAIHMSGQGSLKPICEQFWSDYQSGKSFESSLNNFRAFDTLEETSDLILQAYRSGFRESTFQKLADKLASYNLSDSRNRNSRLQLFTTSYTLTSTVLPAVQASISMATGNSTQALMMAFLMSASLVILWKIVE